jgi:hypothetical protein
VSLAATRRRRRLRRPRPPDQTETVELNFGRPHGADPQFFVGCGWSYWHTLDFPCLSGELDDAAFMRNETFEVAAPSEPPPPPRTDALPLCGTDAEFLSSTAGRWVQEPFPSDDECLVPFEEDKNYSSRFAVHRFHGDKPHCWHREAIDQIGLRCTEPNCALIDRSRYWNSRARVSRWMGVWRDYSCDYVEFTDRELQQCVDAKKIAAIQVEGASVAQNLASLLHQRVDRLTVYPNVSDPDAIQVTISTLSLLHLTMDSNSMFRRKLRSLKNATENDVRYVYTGYYTSSEREPYTHADRLRDMNRIVEEELVPKGYHLLNIYDLSAAWAFDADGQRDGMHIVGPPLRMGLTKFFHHLCRGAVPGTRV